MLGMNLPVRKIRSILVGLAYYNICLLLIAADVYFNILTLLLIALDQLFFVADILIRPVTPREKADLSTKLIGLLFLLHPFLLALLFYENLYLTAIFLSFLNESIVTYIGFAIYMFGVVVTLTSRVQLGRYGSGIISIEDKHELLSTGMYRHIRNPLYSGALVGRIGIVLVFRGYILGFLMFLTYFLIFRKRIEIEEEMLESEFGEEYLSYKERTKRLIPYVW